MYQFRTLKFMLLGVLFGQYILSQLLTHNLGQRPDSLATDQVARHTLHTTHLASENNRILIDADGPKEFKNGDWLRNFIKNNCVSEDSKPVTTGFKFDCTLIVKDPKNENKTITQKFTYESTKSGGLQVISPPVEANDAYQGTTEAGNCLECVTFAWSTPFEDLGDVTNSIEFGKSVESSSKTFYAGLADYLTKLYDKMKTRQAKRAATPTTVATPPSGPVVLQTTARPAPTRVTDAGRSDVGASRRESSSRALSRSEERRREREEHRKALNECRSESEKDLRLQCYFDYMLANEDDEDRQRNAWFHGGKAALQKLFDSRDEGDRELALELIDDFEADSTNMDASVERSLASFKRGVRYQAAIQRAAETGDIGLLNYYRCSLAAPDIIREGQWQQQQLASMPWAGGLHAGMYTGVTPTDPIQTGLAANNCIDLATGRMIGQPDPSFTISPRDNDYVRADLSQWRETFDAIFSSKLGRTSSLGGTVTAGRATPTAATTASVIAGRVSGNNNAVALTRPQFQTARPTSAYQALNSQIQSSQLAISGGARPLRSDLR